MKKRERIEALEKRVEELEGHVGSLNEALNSLSMFGAYRVHPFSGTKDSTSGTESQPLKNGRVRVGDIGPQATAGVGYQSGGWISGAKFVENPNAGKPQAHTSGFVQVLGDLPPATEWKTGPIEVGSIGGIKLFEDESIPPDTVVISPEAIAKANAPNDMRVVIETKDTPDGFQMNVRTHERGTGYPITESDESKRIAEAVANTPHSC